MGDLSRNFSRWEFSCRCGCGFNAADFELIKVLEDLRDFFKCPISISGPNRCPKYNATIPGAASDSMHIKGMAADVIVSRADADEVAEYLEKTYPDTYGIGRYEGRTHVDVRKSPARWDKR